MTTRPTCDYCFGVPAFPVVYTEADGTETTLYLCAKCDQAELAGILDQRVEELDAEMVRRRAIRTRVSEN